MKKLVFILLPIFAFMFLACSDGGEGTTQKTEPKAIVETEDEAKSKPVQRTFSVGEKVEFGDYIISVENVENPFIYTGEFSDFMSLDEGKKLVAVEVLYRNETDDKVLSYNPFDWTLYDSEGYSYTGWSMYSKEPELNAGNVNSGGQSRGWITFETLENSEGFTIQFSDTFLTSDNVMFEL